MSDENLESMGMVLGCAVKVIVSACTITGQEMLARDVLEMWKAEDFERLAATFEAMSASLPRPEGERPC